MSEEKNIKLCSDCGAEINIKAKICPKCGVEQPIIPKKVSNWWYVFSFFLGIVGGAIAWIFNKDRNPKKAIRFLITGFILPIIYIIGFIILFILYETKEIVVDEVPLSGERGAIGLLGEAREKANDMRTISDMNQIRSVAELIYSSEKGYSLLDCTYYPDMIFLCQSIKLQSGKEPIIHSSQNDYCAYVKLLSGDYYCINNKEITEKNLIYPGETGYCDGKTFVCP